MKSEVQAVWNKLRTYQFDQPGSVLNFSKRLQRENGWDEIYTQRVLEEYLRFMFLSRFAGHSVTPSDQVDQAWHLHLLYSDEYFNNFCPNYLGEVVHHGPTQGGTKENNKYKNWYSKTLFTYKQIFGESPPKDIWPGSAERFQDAAAFRRVNMANMIQVKRRIFDSLVTITIVALAYTITSLTFDYGQDGNPPLVFTLVLYSLLGIIGLLAYRWYRDRKGYPYGGCGTTGGGCGGCGFRETNTGGIFDSSGDSSASGCGSGCGGGCGGS
ncbi:MAG: hypothetical protein PVG75_00185 [Thioalkalispiraceae bacterium]|jgi:hypothetical protein